VVIRFRKPRWAVEERRQAALVDVAASLPLWFRHFGAPGMTEPGSTGCSGC
jgi:hypothetical protein